MPHIRVFVGILIAALVTADAGAQTVTGRAADIRFGGRMHAQYAASSVGPADNGFHFRRVRLIADISVNDFFDARIQPDFAGGTAALQDAYVRFLWSERFKVSAGQFKRAFDLFDLSSSTDLSIIERDGRVPGAGSCTGVGGVCSLTRLAEKLEFAGRDQGVRLEGSEGRVGWMATVTNGTGINTADENDAKSFSGRLTVDAGESVRVGGAWAVHDYVGPDDANGHAVAWTADVEFGGWRDGLHVQLAATRGDNWKALDADGNEAPFTAIQGWATYFVPLDGPRLSGVEPVLRIGFADPDGNRADDGAALLTPGLMLYVGGRNKVGFNVDVFSPQSGDREYSLKVQSYLYF